MKQVLRFAQDDNFVFGMTILFRVSPAISASSAVKSAVEIRNTLDHRVSKSVLSPTGRGEG